MSRKSKEGGLVYSTAHGRMCPVCSKPVADCVCKKMSSVKPRVDGCVRITLETKGRKGKGVTVLAGLPLDSAELEKLCKDLKQRCGSGGTVKDGQIEIQGDHRAAVADELGRRDLKFKMAGG